MQPSTGEASSTRGPQRFEGRTALVTGGGWNIGRRIAERFAGLGARVVVAGRRSQRLAETVDSIESAGGRALAVRCDCSDPSQVDSLIEQSEAAFGPIDILAGFAGGGMTPAPMEELDPSTILRVIQDNLVTAALCTRAVLPGFKARDRGTVLLAAGGGAFHPVLGSHLNVYAAAKAGVCRLVDQLTAEHWESDLRFFAVDPGRVPGPDELDEFTAFEAREGREHPGREGAVSADLTAELATFLASEGSRPLRGRCVGVHDGFWRDPASREAVEATIHAYRLRRADL